MEFLVKLLGDDVYTFHVTLFRAVFGLVLIMPPAIMKSGIAVFRTNCFHLHILRGLVSALGITAGFYAVMRMPLATATTIAFMAPMFITLLAFLIYRERISTARWAGVALGFMGVLLVSRPDASGLSVPALVALFGALAVGGAKLMVKELAKRDGHVTILLYLGINMTLMAAIPGWVFWQPLSMEQYGLLILIGGLSIAAQSCVIRGYSAAPASALAPFEYSRLIFASTIGFLVFGEILETGVILGMLVITAGMIFVARGEGAGARSS